MADLYIIAAGNGSRMGGDIPKALVEINPGVPNLTTTLQQVGEYFGNVFVVYSLKVKNSWDAYMIETREKYPTLLENVHFLGINSGLGDGHAVMEALKAAEAHNAELDMLEKWPVVMSEEIVICWGDVFFPDDRIMKELLESYDAITVPAVHKKNPYVTLKINGPLWEVNEITHAEFSKLGEHNEEGYHDQSVFKFQFTELLDALTMIHYSMWRGDKYITPNGELSLLHVFHYLYNIECPALVYETNFPTLSFNTREEVAAIQSEINSKWQSTHRS